jgi:predicted nucleic acid-binding protein
VSGPRVVVDTNVFLAAREPRESGFAAARAFLGAVDEGRFVALVSVITLAELRAGFSSAQMPAMWTPFLSHLLASESIEVEPVDEAIAIAAGALRNERGLSLPDSLICATASERSAICIATNDHELLAAKPPVVARRPAELMR